MFSFKYCWGVTTRNSNFDARLAYAPKGSGLEFSIWGKNLSNTLYQSHVIAFLDNGFSLFGPPRTVGASLSWNVGGGR